MQYTVAIIEDEKHQRDTLIHLLNELFPDLKVIATASSVPDGVLLLQEVKPDLVFLDVLLPPFTSFDLLDQLQAIPFDIIFTTSFEEYALKAFRLSAVDYLLKPVAESELMAAVNKFREKRSSKDRLIHIQTLVDNLKTPQNGQRKIALPTFTGYLFIKVGDIIRCEADNTYTTFFTTDKKKIVVSKTMKECEQLLSEYGFFRVHNSHLINLEYISEYVRGEGGIVKMTDGSQIDVSRRRKEEFLHLLKNP